MFNLNPIDVLNRRETTVLPVHFSKIKVSETDMFDGKVKQWIQTKLKGRFCIVKSPTIDQSGNLKSATVVGFEEQKELTYFMLACPHLRRN